MCDLTIDMFDYAKKISRLNVSGFNDLITFWNAWKGKHMIKGDRGVPAKNSPMLKLVSLIFWDSNFLGIVKNLPSFDVNERLYSVHLKQLFV